MIEILPMEERAAEETILGGIKPKESNARVLAMTERGTLLGWVAVDILDGSLRMLRFELEGQAGLLEPERVFYLDTLMRSAASYGEVNGADKLETITPELNDFFQKRGFETDDTHAFGPMSLIVRYE